MMPKSVIIHKKRFRTKAQAEKHVRKKLQTLHDNHIRRVTLDSDEWLYLQYLTARLPDFYEKIGPGVREFVLFRNKKDDISLALTDIRNEFVKVSWLRCITQKEPEDNNKLKDAMNNVAGDQRDEFLERTGPDFECFFCKGSIIETPQVHHTDPRMKEIRREFLKKNPLPVNAIYTDDRIKGSKRGFRDKVYEYMWAHFHKERANLVPCHKSCHTKFHQNERRRVPREPLKQRSPKE